MFVTESLDDEAALDTDPWKLGSNNSAGVKLFLVAFSEAILQGLLNVLPANLAFDCRLAHN